MIFSMESCTTHQIKPTGNESTGDDANNNAHNNAQRDTVVMSAGSKSRAGSPTDEQIQRLDEKTGMVRWWTDQEVGVTICHRLVARD